MKQSDLLLAAGLLLAALLLFLVLRTGGAGAYVVVTIDGREAARYPLDEDRTVTLGGEDYNVLEISGGAAAITGANCGDHTCVRTGKISRQGESIICLPHRLTVQVEGAGDAAFDAASR